MRTRQWCGLGLVGLLLAPAVILAAEARAAAGRDYFQPGDAPVVAGQFGVPGLPLINLAVLGDSTGAGLGVSTVQDSVGGQLAMTLSETGRFVHLVGLAVSGARVAGLAPQVARLAQARADGEADGPLVVVVLIGVNDATHLTALSLVRNDLHTQLLALRALGAQVVLATCPDVGAALNFEQPLRTIAGWRGRAVARAENTAAAGISGVSTVDLAARTGPEFRADPSLLSRDLFHPSASGYALWAKAMAPATVAAAAKLTHR